ncbi:MAG: folylpolyglutamate synthase/dihydrofolate synthase family protein [Rikenellaceae bacterium]
MEYKEALETLEALPMFQNVGGSAYIPSMDNIIALSSLLGNPQTKYPTIHIAGTNGKGSTAHMIASVLQTAGYKVGLYTSPHIADLRERVRIDGELVKEEIFAELITKISGYMKSHKVSFFEVTTALAFYSFSRETVDVAVIETGLGGLWDSTNIITPIVSVITNISLDHCAILGNTKGEIARQKGGIIKTSVPVVIGEHDTLCDDIFIDIASQTNSPLTFAQDHFTVEDKNGLFLVTGDKSFTIDGELRGEYQKKNIATVLSTLKIISNRFTISDTLIKDGIEKACTNTGLSGRWQTLKTNPTVVCDTGHNVGGITYVAHQIEQTPHKNLFIVMGVMADKEVEGILRLMPKQATYLFCHTASQRAMDSKTLQERASKLGIKGTAIGEKGTSSVAEALSIAMQQATREDLIFIGGSTFIVADILSNAKWLKSFGFSTI